MSNFYKKSKNNLRIVSCIENAINNIRQQFKVFKVIRFWVIPNNKIDFVKSRFCIKILVFIISFLPYLVVKLKIELFFSNTYSIYRQKK